MAGNAPGGAGRAQPIDFAALAEALLDQAERLVPDWLPGGARRGAEWVCADFAGGQGGSLSVNLKTGRWADFARDERGGDLISLYAAIHGLNNGQAAATLMAELGLRRGGVQAPAPAVAPPAPRKREDGRSTWVPVVPVPEHAPEPTFEHHARGRPQRVWTYRRDGQVLGHVVRFETSDGGKEILPYTWCQDTGDDRGVCRWHWMQWGEPRPLYLAAGLLSDEAMSAGLLPVVLVEGEKCADAGHALLPAEFDWVTWPGGSNAWDKADWAWLSGRPVLLWADADAKREKLSKAEREAGVDPASKPLLPEERQPGVKCMRAIGARLLELGCKVFWCPVPAPGQVPDGWDVADAIQQGWDAEQVRAFLRGARAFSAAARAGEGAEKKSRPGAAAGEGQEGDDAKRRWWWDELLRTEKGQIAQVRENVVIALDGGESREKDHAWMPGIEEVQGLIAFNEFTSDVVKLRPAPWGSAAGLWEEVDELLMGEWLTRRHYLPSMSRGTLEEATRMVAYRHRYHPVRQWLEGLAWDGVPRLATWLRRAVLEEDEWDDRAPLQRYLARVGTWFLQGMVARVMAPGTKFDYMLILEGAQGLRKSTLLRVLAGDWFADTGLVLGDKDSYQQLQGRWLYEFGELDSFGKAEVTKIKSFIASAADYFRASFDRRAREYPRQIVFGGTTNEDHYLTDPTGNRRFWPVRVTRTIDIDWVVSVREQLFAEALHRWREGARMHPTPEEERQLFAPQQEQRAVSNAIEDAVLKYLYDPDQKLVGERPNGSLVDEISLTELLGRIGIGLEKLGPGRFHEKQAAAALRRHRWVERRSSAPGRPRLYVRPKGDAAGLAGASLSISASPARAGDAPEDPNGCPF